MHRTTILVIDNDPVLVKLLKSKLEAGKYRVFSAGSGGEAALVAEECVPDLIILDVLLPDMDGRELYRSIRAWQKTPIIILSALAEIQDKVRCLDMGADDYLTKPFSIEELMARMRAVLRRSETAAAPPVPSFSCCELSINFSGRWVARAGSEVGLTPTEFGLLAELAMNADKALSYTQILNRVWGREYEGEKEYVREYIRHLRDKLEDNPGRPEHIVTVKGFGYMFKRQHPGGVRLLNQFPLTGSACILP